MCVRHFIISLEENKLRLAHSFSRVSHKISRSLSVIRVRYFMFGTPYYASLPKYFVTKAMNVLLETTNNNSESQLVWYVVGMTLL